MDFVLPVMFAAIFFYVLYGVMRAGNEGRNHCCQASRKVGRGS
jgi:hypothetical protein